MSGLAVAPLRAHEEDRPTMPVVSKAQNAAMHAAAAGKSTLGIPKKVGAEFTADQKPGSVKRLPQRVKAKSKPKAKAAHKPSLNADEYDEMTRENEWQS